jgi:phospholipase/carboxylesterase
MSAPADAPDLGFAHRFAPGADPDGPTLLLLHGTGGSEDDLLPLGRALAPDWAVLSPRGPVLENGMPRFFRRLAEGVFDVEDLVKRTGDLADFVERATAHYGLHPRKVVAVGFSNGANIAASVLLLRPGALRAAILFRAMVPLEPDLRPDLHGTSAFLSAGQMDPIVPGENTERLADLLRAAGADVTLRWHPAGHGLTPGDVSQAKGWLDGQGF